MNKTSLIRLLIAVILTCSAYTCAVIVEYCSQASAPDFLFELKNKSDQDIEFILYVDYTPLVHERIKKMKNGRYNLVRAGDFEVENSISLRCWPVGQYHKAQHVQLPVGKTIYLKYKNSAIKPQKGNSKNKTKSGLFLTNNVQPDEIMKWQTVPPKF